MLILFDDPKKALGDKMHAFFLLDGFRDESGFHSLSLILGGLECFAPAAIPSCLSKFGVVCSELAIYFFG